MGTVVGLLLAIAALHVEPATAQLPLEVWLRPLIAVPIGDFSDRDDGVEARPSLGFDAGGAVTFGALTLYGEYQEVSFGCGECEAAGLDETVLDRGWGAGVVVPLPLSPAGIRPWARLGVIGHHLRFRSAEESAHSDSALGWSAGLGFDLRPLSWLRLEPAVLLRSYDARFAFALDLPAREASVTHAAFGLALVVEP